MNFNKYPAPVNFRYVDGLRAERRAKGPLALRARRGGVTFALLDDGLIRVTSTLSAARPRKLSAAELSARLLGEARVERAGDGKAGAVRLSGGEVEVVVRADTGEFAVFHDGDEVVRSAAAPFGVCGAKTVALLDRPADTVVYGLGEKTGGLDKSNRVGRCVVSYESVA